MQKRSDEKVLKQKNGYTLQRLGQKVLDKANGHPTCSESPNTFRGQEQLKFVLGKGKIRSLEVSIGIAKL